MEVVNHQVPQPVEKSGGGLGRMLDPEGNDWLSFDESDWWMTSAVTTRQPMSKNHDGDIPAPEWMVFGDTRLKRVLFMLHHEDDAHSDRFYQTNRQMTVFGLGRQGINKFFDRVPQSFSIGFLEMTGHEEINAALKGYLDTQPTGNIP